MFSIEVGSLGDVSLGLKALTTESETLVDEAAFGRFNWPSRLPDGFTEAFSVDRNENGSPQITGSTDEWTGFLYSNEESSVGRGTVTIAVEKNIGDSQEILALTADGESITAFAAILRFGAFGINENDTAEGVTLRFDSRPLP